MGGGIVILVIACFLGRTDLVPFNSDLVHVYLNQFFITNNYEEFTRITREGIGSFMKNSERNKIL